MVETTFNLFDAIVVGIVILSSLLSFFRGFVRELLSLGAWVGAAFVTLVYSPGVAEALRGDVSSGPIALLVASAALFFGAKIFFSIINLMLMKLLKPGEDVGVFDNMLGLVFGVLRAGLLISLAYYVYSFVAPEDNQPEWIATSQTRPIVAQGSEMLEPLLEDFMDEIAPLLEDRAEAAQPGSSETFNQLLDAAKNGGLLNNGDESPDSQWMDVDQMQQLLEQSEQMRETQENKEELRRLLEQKRQQQTNQPLAPGQ